MQEYFIAKTRVYFVFKVDSLGYILLGLNVKNRLMVLKILYINLMQQLKKLKLHLWTMLKDVYNNLLKHHQCMKV